MKNRVSSLVNIVGLSLSMVIGILLFTVVKNNWETDHFHPYIENTFRITTHIKDEKGMSRWATCPQPMAEWLDKLSFVDKTTVVRNAGSWKIQGGMREIPVEISFIEPSFFEIFGFQLLTGNLKAFFYEENLVLLG